MHMDDVERHECTVNNNELAVHAGALQRSKRQLPVPYGKNPSVCPRCLGKNKHLLPAKRNMAIQEGASSTSMWVCCAAHFNMLSELASSVGEK